MSERYVFRMRLNVGGFSALVETLDIEGKIAPVAGSTEFLGHITPQIAKATGLPPPTPVAVGIHDPNASLYPHMLTQAGPFSVVSTGTWVVVMSIGARSQFLDPDRDTLMNVNAEGALVPSARFMGGREYEAVQRGQPAQPTKQDVAVILRDKVMLLPAVEPWTGPFRGHQMRWVGSEPEVGAGRRSAALSFYLAMMTDTCLRLTGASGPTIVEGPFARNQQYLSMLAAATGRPVLQSQSETGTSIGAALLFGTSKALAPAISPDIAETGPEWRAYALQWRQHVGES